MNLRVYRTVVSGQLARFIAEPLAIAIFSLMLIAVPAFAGDWSPTGSLATARNGHTATLLPNGKVLVVGGANGNTVLANAELYDPATGTWLPASSMQNARIGHTATLLANGKVLVAGGRDSSIFIFASAEIYDPATNSWSPAASMANSRSDFIAGLLPDGRVLVAGGGSSSSIFEAAVVVSLAEIYDPVADVWSSTASMHAPRQEDAASVLLTGQVLVSGADTDVPAADLYDPSSGTWLVAGALFTPRFQQTSTLLSNGNVIITGGSGFDSSSAELASVELYTPSRNSWSSLAPMTMGRVFHTASLLPSGRILATGGANGMVFGTTSAELYNPVANQWVPTDSMSQGRATHTATTLQTGQVLVAGGSISNLSLASAELYTPPTAPPAIGSSTSVVPYQSTADALTLNLGTLPIGSLALVAQPGHGTASVNGAAITYTPNLLYAGSDSLTYTATNELGTSAAATVSITVSPPVLAVTPMTLPNPQIGVAYNQTLSVSGGTAPYRFSISAGALPTGLTLSTSTGSISGTTTQAGAASFSVTALDSSGGSGPFGGTTAFSVSIPPPVIALAPETLPNPQIAIAYSQVINASGGTAPYSFTISAGALPAGLTLNASTGAISGVPTAIGAANFTATATDSTTGTGPFAGVFAYSIAVLATLPAPPTASPLSTSTSCGTPVVVDLANGITGGDITGVALAGLPSQGTARLTGEVVTYTPQSNNCSAMDSFTYTATNAGGMSPPAAVTVSITPAVPSTLAASILPGGRSVQLGTPATVFATILNAAAQPVQGCQIGLAAGAPPGLSLSYQTTNPATNALTGQPNTPASIGAQGIQTYVLSLTATSPLTLTAQPLVFFCSAGAAAAALPGVNTIDLTFSSAPVPDIVALAATASNDATIHVPNGGDAAFAVATINLGAAASLTVSADAGAASLPIAVTLCQTDPSTGQCQAPPSAAISFTANANATPTFSIFVQAAGPVPFAPGTSRLFVRFKDNAGNAHGSTSVAVTTQ